MKYNADDILKIKRFCQDIINRPRPIDDQPHVRQDGKMWCEDWEIIEICKYLFNGRSGYIGDPPPNRLKNNPLWSKEEIMGKAEDLINGIGEMDQIILALRKRREG